MQFIQRAAPEHIVTGSRYWDDLSIKEQDDFLFSCIHGDWEKKAGALDLHSETARGLMVYFRIPVDLNKNKNKIELETIVLNCLGRSGQLGKRLSRAIDRRDNNLDKHGEPRLFKDVPIEKNYILYKDNDSFQLAVKKSKEIDARKEVINNLLLFGIPSALLFFSIFPHLPYWYYQILKISICLFSLLLVAVAADQERKTWIGVFVAIAILFNPFIKIHFDRDTWQVIDVICGLVFLVAGYIFWRKPAERDL